jgi:multidrug transporter EmrE-like cation transporter
MKLPEFQLLMTGVLLNAAAQLLLKVAAQSVGPIAPGLAGARSFATALAITPACWAALLAYALSVGVWTAGLSRVPVSQAYPLLSVGYALMLLAGWWMFGETPSLMRVTGIAVIIAGVAMVAAS